MRESSCTTATTRTSGLVSCWCTRAVTYSKQQLRARSVRRVAMIVAPRPRPIPHLEIVRGAPSRLKYVIKVTSAMTDGGRVKSSPCVEHCLVWLRAYRIRFPQLTLAMSNSPFRSQSQGGPRHPNVDSPPQEMSSKRQYTSPSLGHDWYYANGTPWIFQFCP